MHLHKVTPQIKAEPSFCGRKETKEKFRSMTKLCQRFCDFGSLEVFEPLCRFSVPREFFKAEPSFCGRKETKEKFRSMTKLCQRFCDFGSLEVFEPLCRFSVPREFF